MRARFDPAQHVEDSRRADNRPSFRFHISHTVRSQGAPGGGLNRTLEERNGRVILFSDCARQFLIRQEQEAEKDIRLPCLLRQSSFAYYPQIIRFKQKVTVRFRGFNQRIPSLYPEEINHNLCNSFIANWLLLPELMRHNSPIVSVPCLTFRRSTILVALRRAWLPTDRLSLIRNSCVPPFRIGCFCLHSPGKTTQRFSCPI